MGVVSSVVWPGDANNNIISYMYFELSIILHSLRLCYNRMW